MDLQLMFMKTQSRKSAFRFGFMSGSETGVAWIIQAVVTSISAGQRQHQLYHGQATGMEHKRAAEVQSWGTRYLPVYCKQFLQLQKGQKRLWNSNGIRQIHLI